MADSPSGTSRPLTQHIDELYPLARVLDADVEADALVAATYRRALQTPPEDRPDAPDAVRAWLYSLLLQVRDEERTAKERRRKNRLLRSHRIDDTGTPSPTESAPEDASGNDSEDASGDSSGDDSEATAGDLDAIEKEDVPSVRTNSSFRRDVAQQSAERALPVAFAACSARERLLLTLDILGDLSTEQMAHVIGLPESDVPDRRSDAHASLRAALRDTLTGPERMLVDVALPEEALQESLRALLTSRFRPAPASLRSEVAVLLKDAGLSPDRPRRTSSRDRRASESRWATFRSIAAGLAVIAVVAAGLYGLVTVFQPSPEPEPTLLEYTSRRADAVRSVTDIATPARAATYVDSVWNRRLTPPTFASAALTGVGRLRFSDDLEVPVLVYADSITGGRITTFAYTYALIDRIEDQAQLDRALRDRLSRPGATVAQRIGGNSVLVWRDRDDIFLAVSGGSPTQIQERLRAPSEP